MRRSAPVMVLAFLACAPQRVAGQYCESYISNDFPGVCQGGVYIQCDFSTDSVVWSNGVVGYGFSAPTGTYTYDAYTNGVVVLAGSVTVGSHGWDIYPLWGGPTLNGYLLSTGATIVACNTMSYMSPCCVPDPVDVEVYLVDDNLAVLQDPCLQCHTHECFMPTTQFYMVPCGHSYHVRVMDAGCAGQVDDTLHTIIVHNNANLVLDTATTGSVPGFNTGIVELLEAVPDTTELFPIYGPVTGTAVLYEGLNSSTIVAQFAGVADAIWTGLDTGYYRLCFVPDSGCQVICDTLYVPAVASNGVSESQGKPALSLVPTATTGLLTLHARNAEVPVQITITDALGREVSRMRMAPGPFSVEQLPRGAYVLTAVQGSERLRVRFLKE